MDRNLPCFRRGTGVAVVALRKESVDRNNAVQVIVIVMDVALRKESVDRNISPHSISCMILTSLSARRAWIEMGWKLTALSMMYGRSPQGERG